MWDILRFLKSPEGEESSERASIPNAEAEKSRIDSQLMDALERTESAIDKISKENTNEVSMDENIFLTETPEEEKASPPKAAEPPRRAEPAKRPVSAPAAKEKKSSSGEDGELLRIPVSSVTPNPFQPRKAMGEDEIMELADSIRELGVLQPILVKRTESGYELLAGERRLRASQRAGLSEIPAMVIQAEPVTQQVIALVENIQRKNLSAIEEALCLEDILSKTGWTQVELSRRMGRSQASIANKLRLLRLDSSVQDLVIAGKLGERQARSLLSLSMEEQRELAQKAIDEDLSARALENLAEAWSSKDAPKRRKGAVKQQSESSDGPAGELLRDISALINRHREMGIPAEWKVKQMDQSSLVVEISVGLLNKTAGSEE